MKNDDLWILWRLSTQEKLERQRFECSLILEFTDQSKPQVIDIDRLSAVTSHPDTFSHSNDNNHCYEGIYHHNQWLHIQRKTAPFSQLHETDVPNQDNVSLLISCFIDVEALLREQPKLAYIYLWAAAKYQKIYLETLYPLAQLRDIELREPNQVFVQIYPRIPSEKYVDMDYEFDDSKTLPELLARIWGNSEPEEDPEKIQESKEQVEPPLTTLKPEISIHKIMSSHDAINARDGCDNHSKTDNIHENPYISEEVIITDGDISSCIWGPFSSQDLADLVQGFNDWQRAYGRHKLADHLPPTLLKKIDSNHQVAYWTSGQGVSNMIFDNNPPRHTMVVGFIENQGQHGIGYCIQKPSSLDNIWAHKQWHTLHCIEGKISKVTPLPFN